MKLTSRSEYALLALIYLARQPQEELIGGVKIARAQSIPRRFLQQILYSLKHARLIRSGKGQAGGYALAKKPKHITIAEVVRLFDGALAPSRSASKNFYQSTPIEREKRVLSLLKEIRSFVADKLEKTTLADVL